MTDHLESYLAKWTGKDAWPYVKAELEARMLLTGSNIKRIQDRTRYEIYAYEVDNILYTASIRTASGYQDRSQIGDCVMVQYNPVNPAIMYYAPACVLANRFMVFLVMLCGAAVVAFAATGILEKR